MQDRKVIRGRLVDPHTNTGVEGSRIDVVDKASGRVVASAWTDAGGAFEAIVREGSAMPPATIPLSASDKPAEVSEFVTKPSHTPQIDTTSPASHYELVVSSDSTAVTTWTTLETVVSTARRPTFPTIKVATLNELRQNEPEILARMQRVPNGGQLFLIHPFLLLADVGVELGAKAREEIIALEPWLGALSPIPYHALKSSKAKQSFRVRVHGLFRRAS